jgi:hypothetical protein
MASEIDMLADGSLGARTEGRGRFGREGPAIAKVEAMVGVDVGLRMNFPEVEAQEEGGVKVKVRVDRMSFIGWEQRR